MSSPRPQSNGSRGSVARTFLIGFLILFGLALLVGWLSTAFA
jgi:hypothetical protein